MKKKTETSESTHFRHMEKTFLESARLRISAATVFLTPYLTEFMNELGDRSIKFLADHWPLMIALFMMLRAAAREVA